MITEAGPATLWTVALLGAYHGLNPGMGWLFAVALGFQKQEGRAVGRALLPMALGHALAVGAAVAAAVLLGTALPLEALRLLVAGVLITLGASWIVRHRHPRWVRMQVGFRDLTLWSFLVASAHGAGLMVVPLLLGDRGVQAAAGMAGHHHAATASPIAGLMATATHTAAYLAVTGLVAWIVYRRVGLAMLRRAWVNVDLVWAGALIVSGLFTLL